MTELSPHSCSIIFTDTPPHTHTHDHPLCFALITKCTQARVGFNFDLMSLIRVELCCTIAGDSWAAAGLEFLIIFY